MFKTKVSGGSPQGRGMLDGVRDMSSHCEGKTHLQSYSLSWVVGGNFSEFCMSENMNWLSVVLLKSPSTHRALVHIFSFLGFSQQMHG